MLITNFSSGELSPTLNGRVDLQQYYQSASHLENFEIIPTGGIQRRAGMKRLVEITKTVTETITDPETEEETKNDTEVPTDARIIPFILDRDNVFIFALYEKAIKVYKINIDHTVTLLQTIIEDDNTKLYDSVAECNEVQYAQNYDTLILVHQNYAPLILKYQFDTRTFYYSTMVFDYYPDVQLDDDYDFVMLPAGESKPILEETTDGHLRFVYSVKNGEGTVQKIKDYNAGVDKVYCIQNGHVWVFDRELGWIIYGNDPEIDETLFVEKTKCPGCVAFFNNRLFLLILRTSPLLYGPALHQIQEIPVITILILLRNT